MTPRLVDRDRRRWCRARRRTTARWPSGGGAVSATDDQSGGRGRRTRASPPWTFLRIVVGQAIRRPASGGPQDRAGSPIFAGKWHGEGFPACPPPRASPIRRAEVADLVVVERDRSCGSAPDQCRRRPWSERNAFRARPQTAHPDPPWTSGVRRVVAGRSLSRQRRLLSTTGRPLPPRASEVSSLHVAVVEGQELYRNGAGCCGGAGRPRLNSVLLAKLNCVLRWRAARGDGRTPDRRSTGRGNPGTFSNRR